ncbi:hypothetical protein Lalb_Chr03g0039961 [Lupinus albus]|uniref:Uncharacterized protein n=1 Tax=Lupinus albus TaxID=3870 RepID=A0A6A4QVH4_LUPAL|nr:hypothetical protein Lalb_Chr03g0039961 [Lupinus albus]
MSAARFSSINSCRAALHLMERSASETQELLLDGRRERTYPAHNKSIFIGITHTYTNIGYDTYTICP